MNIKFLYFSGNPVVGFNVDANCVDKISLIVRLYPSNTFRKKLVRLALLLLVISRFDFFVLRKNLGLADKVKELAPAHIALVLIRFHTLKEKSRCYCFYLNEDKEFTHFGKIAFDGVNSLLLVKESELLKKVNYGDLITPRFFSEANYVDGNYGFLTNAVGADYKEHKRATPFIPEDLLCKLQKEVRSYASDELVGFDWWKRFCNSKKTDFSNKLLDLFDVGGSILLSHVHGDLGSENIFECNRKTEKNSSLVVVDWERYCEKAPYLTDALGYWLGYHHEKILSNSHGAGSLYSLFHEEFISKYNDTLGGYLALVYLISVNFDLAILVAEDYKNGAVWGPIA